MWLDYDREDQIAGARVLETPAREDAAAAAVVVVCYCSGSFVAIFWRVHFRPLPPSQTYGQWRMRRQ